MNTIIFLIFWMPGQSMPTAKFIKSFDTMKECNVMKAAVIDKEVTPHLFCLQAIAEPLADAGGVI